MKKTVKERESERHDFDPKMFYKIRFWRLMA